jgi:hypothetical protein
MGIVVVQVQGLPLCNSWYLRTCPGDREATNPKRKEEEREVDSR